MGESDVSIVGESDVSIVGESSPMDSTEQFEHTLKMLCKSISNE